ncbi:hypothetical protein C4K04_3334 [Pseudomonas chlororaphis]|uniref:Uncharacterized protein n=1 Tax=Pseudomonas chlororaphis TaxID=587753 RepID=A0A3G7TRX9_9PSED|nr:hypothetical protein C4K04_3334 [Pseudomonas chlororaphis]
MDECCFKIHQRILVKFSPYLNQTIPKGLESLKITIADIQIVSTAWLSCASDCHIELHRKITILQL